MQIAKPLIRIFLIMIAHTICLQHIYAAAVIIPRSPTVHATAYALVEFRSGKIIAEKNIDQKIYPASLTKIMTAYVAGKEIIANRITLQEEVLISEKAWRMGGSRMFIEVGKKITVETLLKGMIIQSGNDASVALAEHISGSEESFADLMNQYAKRIGMHNSNFINSTGLPDENHYMTIKDVLKLANKIISETPEIYALHAEKEFSYNNITQQNRNKLLWLDSSVDGIKTGHTESAGFCLVASAKRDNMRLIAVIAGANNDNARFTASRSLLNYGFRFYESQKIYSAYQKITSRRLWKGKQKSLDLGVKNDFYVFFPKGQKEQLEVIFTLPEQISAPVIKHQKQGTIKILLSEEEIASQDLIALDAVEESGIIMRLKDNIQLFFE